MPSAKLCLMSYSYSTDKALLTASPQTTTSPAALCAEGSNHFL